MANPRNVRRLFSVFLLSIVLWAGLYAGTLLHAAPRIKQLPPQSVTIAAIGPLDLVRIAKIQDTAGPGYVLSFTMQHGAGVLAILCVAMGNGAVFGLPWLYQRSYRRTMVHNSKK